MTKISIALIIYFSFALGSAAEMLLVRPWIINNYTTTTAGIVNCMEQGGTYTVSQANDIKTESCDIETNKNIFSHQLIQ